MGMGDFGYFFQIDQVCIGIADAFHKIAFVFDCTACSNPVSFAGSTKLTEIPRSGRGMGKIVEGSSVKRVEAATI